MMESLLDRKWSSLPIAATANPQSQSRAYCISDRFACLRLKSFAWLGSSNKLHFLCHCLSFDARRSVSWSLTRMMTPSAYCSIFRPSSSPRDWYSTFSYSPKTYSVKMFPVVSFKCLCILIIKQRMMFLV